MLQCAPMIFCSKLKREAQALLKPPFPGEAGLRIQKLISAEAWGLWLAHQTMLINENRLSPVDPKAKAYLNTQRELYLFGEGADQPIGFVAPSLDL
jgi:Fe-S cluster biosynthesis and repair protein YggX